VLKNLLQIALEALVGQQSVGLVEHYELQIGQIVLQVSLIMEQLVDEATRRRDYDMGYVGKLLGLLHHVHASDDDASAEVEGVACKYQELVSNLKCKLARWRDDQGENTVGVLGKLLQDWDGKARRLSRACMCAADNMIAMWLERMHESFFLDQGRPLDANCVQVSDEPRRNIELFE